MQHDDHIKHCLTASVDSSTDTSTPALVAWSVQRRSAGKCQLDSANVLVCFYIIRKANDFLCRSADVPGLGASLVLSIKRLLPVSPPADFVNQDKFQVFITLYLSTYVVLSLRTNRHRRNVGTLFYSYSWHKT